ncbi:hypothetical protein HDU81_006131 [Chytriomyces hyalinus]|nr:hypothetical protein HDU81_006131 [Chytriomyces hyalinus]
MKLTWLAALSAVQSAALAQVASYGWNVTDFQTMDGSGNNLEHPNWGRAGQAFLRITPWQYGPNQAPSGENRPNARHVSNVLFGRGPWLHNEDGITDFAPSWGVMLHLDLTVADRNDSDPFPIPLPPDEQIFKKPNDPNPEIPVSRTSYIGVDEEANVRHIPNAFTSFIDCSGLYGNSFADATSMRSFQSGRLKSVMMDTGEYPPILSNGYFAYTIGNINMMPHLLLPYLMFFREHNRRANELSQVHPTWDDELLYQRARRWVISLVQRITAEFYIPAVTGDKLDAYTGYKPSVHPQIDLFFANVAFRYGHSAVNNLITRIDDYGNQVPEGHLRFHNAFYDKLVKEIVQHGVESMLRGFASQRDQVVDTHFSQEIRNYLPLNPGHHFDLAAIGIQRSRDLGIPDYNTMRRFWNMTPALYWSDITSDVEVQEILSELYDINDLDSYVGAFAEDKVDKNAIVGPMMRASVREQFTRIRDGDRFWYENPGVLSPEEYQNVTQFTFGDMIRLNTNLTHYPDNPFIGVKLNSLYFVKGPSAAESKDGLVNSVTVLNTLRLAWRLRQLDGFIDFTFESNATGWFGFGFGNNMLGADIYFCSDNGSGTFTVQDSWSTATVQVPSDVAQGGVNNIINGTDDTASQTYSKRVVTFTRALSTGDRFDVDIVEADMNIIFAFSQDSQLTWHGPENRMGAIINFYSDSSPMSEKERRIISPGLKAIHGSSMYLSFGFIYPMGIFVARYSRNLGKWLSIHRSLMTLVTSNVLMAALTAVVGNYGDVTFVHYKLGMTVISLICTTATLGYLSVSFHENMGKYRSWAERVRILHRFLGLSSYLLGIVTGYFGACDISASTSFSSLLPWIYVCTVGLTPICLVTYGEYQKYIQNAMPVVTDGDVDSLPIFTWDDVNQRVGAGSKWVIIDNIIYDVQNYLPSHPGGQTILLRMVGLDATSNFHALEFGKKTTHTGLHQPNKSPHSTLKRRSDRSFPVSSGAVRVNDISSHQHSRFAKFILAGLAVGKLRGEEQEHDLPLKTTKMTSSWVVGKSLSRPESVSEDGRNHIAPPISSERYTTFMLDKKIALGDEKERSPIYMYRFLFKYPDSELHVKPGHCFLFQFVTDDGRIITRSYWCINSVNRGGVDFLIKMVGGEMTKYLMDCTSVRMRGPIPDADVSNPYTENGTWKVIGLITEGIGLTAAMLIIDYHLRNCRRDPMTNRPLLQIHLLATFTNESDMFAQKELAQLESSADGALVVTFLLKVSLTRNYSGLVGNITSELIMATMPKPEMGGWMTKSRRSGNDDDSYSAGVLSPTSTMRGEGITRRYPSSSKSGFVGEQSEIAQTMSMRSARHMDDNMTHSVMRHNPMESTDGVEGVEHMAIIICGSTTMHIAVGDTLQELGYQKIFTLHC